MRVATFNIRTSHGRDGRDTWWVRRRAFVAALVGLEADVVGLQEVRTGQLRYLRRRVRPGQLVGDGREREGGGEHASVLVRGWEIESAATRWLSATPDVPGSLGWDAALPRVATLVRLRRDGVRIGVLNTHLDHRGRVARARSADLIVSWLSAEADRRWVVLGDLNEDPGSAVLRVFTDAGYRPALPDDVPGGTEHAFTGASDRRRIDHILAGPGVEVLGARIEHPRPGGRLPSDHWPLVADLRV